LKLKDGFLPDALQTEAIRRRDAGAARQEDAARVRDRHVVGDEIGQRRRDDALDRFGLKRVRKEPVLELQDDGGLRGRDLALRKAPRPGRKRDGRALDTDVGLERLREGLLLREEVAAAPLLFGKA
jgi:hypothetical protein